MLLKEEILFTPTDEMRTLHIHLPEHYDETDDRYPVMYFFDGHNLFRDEDATYGKSWGLEDFLADWPKDIIIVGVECSHVGDNRLIEYCPYSIHGHKFFGDLDGTGKATLGWMAETLKPMIDREFRTYSFREATGIGGSSMGGLMSIYGIARYNEVYSKAACLSPSISACMDDLLRDIGDNEIDPDTRVYFSVGTKEGGQRMNRLNRTLADEFEKSGARTRVYLQKKGAHCEADWEKQNPLYMDFLWRDL